MDNNKITAMREGGKVLSEIMSEAVEKAVVGVSGMDLENLTMDLIKKYHVEPSFTRVEGYKHATCICVNDVIVHGIPTKEPFVENDIVGIDMGVYYKGFHTDMSWSKVIVGKKITQETKNRQKFLQIGAMALVEAIKEVKAGGRIGQISEAIQKNVEKFGLTVVPHLVGHAVGKELHEYPQIPGILSKKIEKTPLIVPGMTLAVEVIYTDGGGEIVYKNKDGWSIASRDGSFSGLFEATVAVGEKSTEILTPFAGLLNGDGFDIIT